ncbi:N,N-dimethylformamidase beta subunit family domain-containing protein [Micromonospora sp. RTP1Z1]|uniref:N,N-dimethylformamidase beta subunit family domain-containing protein n=1 Tax=Micromonospora sp. RTP1Z1 TaxID=2994043 RepID=UPI0029C63A27|nr:N,N-dimethylformamidase beta subunit family domain-containing protein [Micromonospora sp. RTP1Z1]
MLGAFGAAAVLGGGACRESRPSGAAPPADPHYPGDPAGADPAIDRSLAPGRPTVAAENARSGANGFRLTGHRFATDRGGEIAGYVHATSVAPGEEMEFRVSVARSQRYRITIFRVGHYGGAGARTVAVSPWLDGVSQDPPVVDPLTRAVSCAWRTGWRLPVTPDRPSGLHLALLSSASGHHQWIPFVVRDPAQPTGGLVVLPTSTWQAYNIWPADGRTGASLYYGQDAAGRLDTARRARAVGHDRPYSGNGIPQLAAHDIGFVQWVEAQGLDVTYATSEDLHTGRVNPASYPVVIFPGHDEYWSAPMRRAVVAARNRGTSLVFLGANNCYWRTDYGLGDRLVRCEKSPPMTRWRSTGNPEQQLIGAQYVSVVDGYAPLEVRDSRHWFWAGTGVRDGDLIPEVVWGEADQRMPGVPRPRAVEQTLLADSPYSWHGKTHRQHTHLYRAPSGAWVFAAGSLGWTRVLADPTVADPRLARATANLLHRVLAEQPAPVLPVQG